MIQSRLIALLNVMRFVHLWKLLAVLICAACALAAQVDSLAGQSRLGKQLMDQGRFAEAAAVYQELVSAVPNNPGLLLNLGMALHLSGDERGAIAPLEAALRLQPALFPAAFFLGASYVTAGEPARAVAPLEKALRAQPENHQARVLLADALLALERYGDAELHLRKLSQANPDDPAVWFKFGRACEGLALDAFARLEKLAPDSAFFLALLAESRAKQHERASAFSFYRQALARAPKMRGLHGGIADVYRASGHDDWAAIEERRERALPRPVCPRDRLECAFAAGRFRELLAAARPLKTPESLYWQTRSYNQLALDAFNHLTALPPSPEAHQFVAQLLRNQRRFAESIEQWKLALEASPGDPRVKLELAITFRMARDLDSAQALLEDLQRGDPVSPELNFILGDVLLDRQFAERAIPFLEKAVAADSKLLPAHASLGKALVLGGQGAEAVPHLKLALPLDEDGSIRYQLLRAYQAAGEGELARAALKDYEEFRKTAQAERQELEKQLKIEAPKN